MLMHVITHGDWMDTETVKRVCTGRKNKTKNLLQSQWGLEQASMLCPAFQLDAEPTEL